MADYSRQIIVTGLSASVTTDDLELFFESGRYCQCPGTVLNVDLSADKKSAIITFQEENVAKDLARIKTMTLTCQGCSVNISCALLSKVCGLDQVEPSPKTINPSPARSHMDPVQQSEELYPKTEPTDEAEEEPEDLSNAWWSPSPRRSKKMENEDDRSPAVAKRSSDANEIQLLRAKLSALESSTVEEQLQQEPVESVSDDTELVHDFTVRPTSTEKDESRNVHETSENRSFRSLGVNLPVEKIKLLEKLIAFNKVQFPFKVETDTDHKDVRIFGGDDADSMNAKIQVYEILACVSSKPISLSNGIVKLLQSGKGERWLNEQLAQQHLVSVFYVEHDIPHIIAADDEMISDTKRWFADAFATNTVEIESYHSKFLQTPEWANAIAHLTSSSPLLQIKVNTSDMKVTIEGETDDVDAASNEIDQLIQKHSRISREMLLHPGVFRVLYKRRDIIKYEISDFTSKVLIDFDDKSQKLILTGCAEDIKVVEDRIESEYVSNIFYEALKLQLPGLTARDFTVVDNDGHKVIDFIETKHHCSIEVTETTVSRPLVAVVPNASDSPVDHRVNDIANLNRSPTKPASSPNLLPSAIKVVKGNLAEFQADVLVNPLASSKPQLESAGVISAAFHKLAGPELQQELEKNWPRKFGKDVVCTPAYGQIKAKNIYHMAIGRSDDSCSEALKNAIVLCLEMAIKSQMTSIAFPTIGCGKLGFDMRMVAECFVRAEHQCKANLTIYIVAFDWSLKTKFEALITSVPADVSVAGAVFAAADDADTSTKLSHPPAAAPRVSDESSTFEVRQGSLTDFKADVLVNLITCSDHKLEKSGSISKTFLDLGGPELQTKFNAEPFPTKFGQDIAITDACGKLQAKRVYHAAIRKHKDSKSEQYLINMIRTCLKKAEEDSMMSIAFPAIGCGKLGYEPTAVARCFLQAQKDTGAKLKIYIVAFGDKLKKSISDVVFAKAETLKQASPQPTVKPFIRTPQTLNDTILTFHINTADKASSNEVKVLLTEKVTALVGSDEKRSDVVAQLTTEFEMQIYSLQSSDVYIEIDKPGHCVKFRGKRDKLSEVKKKLTAILTEQKTMLRRPEYIKKIKGVPEYLRHLGSMDTTEFPRYWSSKRQADPAVPNRVELDPKSDIFKDVEKLVVGTFEGPVGLGHDARGLSHKAIVVKKIWQNQVEGSFKKYDVYRKTLCKKAADNPFPRVKALKGDEEVRTRKLDLKLEANNLVAEVNEYYLLHGTRKEFISNIVVDGLDFRLAGSSTGTMFGNAIYMAEKSIKADQYADNPDARVGLNQPLYMFVVRALLGNVFVCQVQKQYRRPPCTVDTCLKDDCVDASHNGLRFDSVIGTHRTDGSRLLFREFLVYERAQHYPEFLVEYERQ